MCFHRGTVVFVTAVLALTPSATRGIEASSAPVAAPNIVVLLADDMGFGDPHCFNPDSKAPTPNIDRLARDGRRFTDAHSPASVCSPTRYGLLTGRYAWRTRLKLGVLQPWDSDLIEAGRLTLPGLLKQHGYETFGFGKWHLGWTWSTFDSKPPVPRKGEDFRARIDFTRPIADGPTTRGFDHYFGMVGNTVSEACLLEDDRPVFRNDGKVPDIAGVTRSLLENWDDRKTLPVLTDRVVWTIDHESARKETSKKPFFIYFALTAPHSPMRPYGKFRGLTGHGDSCDFVAQLDDTVGRVLSALDRNGLANNTLVFFTSDNGSPGFADDGAPTASVIKTYDHLPNGRWRGMKGDAHEGGHRVPFIARWPRHVPAATTCDETICLTDLLATTAAVIGARLPADAAEDSVDILPALLGEPHKTPIREATVHHALIGTFAIRQGDWKLILGLGSGGFTMPQYFPPEPGKPAGQLYNLRDDPGETNDLYTRHPEIVKRLTALLDTYQRTGRSTPKPALP